MSRRNAPLRPTGRLRLSSAWCTGRPVHHAAERFQVSHTTAAGWAPETGHPEPRPCQTGPAGRIAAQAGLRSAPSGGFSAGLGLARFARQLDLNPSTVHQILRRRDSDCASKHAARKKPCRASCSSSARPVDVRREARTATECLRHGTSAWGRPQPRRSPRTPAAPQDGRRRTPVYDFHMRRRTRITKNIKSRRGRRSEPTTSPHCMPTVRPMAECAGFLGLHRSRERPPQKLTSVTVLIAAIGTPLSRPGPSAATISRLSQDRRRVTPWLQAWHENLVHAKLCPAPG